MNEHCQHCSVHGRVLFYSSHYKILNQLSITHVINDGVSVHQTLQISMT